jgi:hypothetical protein
VGCIKAFAQDCFVVGGVAMSCIISARSGLAPDASPTQRRRTEKINLAAAREDAKWFKSNKEAVACIRVVRKGEIPGITDSSRMTMVRPIPGGWLKTVLPFCDPPNADPQIIPLNELDVRVVLSTAQNALPGQGFEEAFEHAIRLALAATPAQGTA